jgi:carbon monoxide dehydrogenase subunit G
MRSTLSAFVFVAVAACVLPAVAHADESANNPSQDPQVARLLQEKKTLKWNYTPAGKNDKYGHAEALVDAPADKVAKTITEFSKYKELHKKFATARVVNKDGDKTDVYMRYPVQIGPMKIEFWEVMRFDPVKQNGSTHVLEGTGIKGDMKRGHTVITVKPVDAKHSILQVDILLVPSVPAPQVLIDEELRDGAMDFVNGLKDRAQGWSGPVVSL